MKIALIFSGQLRSLEKTKHFWLKLIKKYNIDVYGSFWDDEDYKLNDTVQNFKSIYNPVDLDIESYKSFEESTVDILKLYIKAPHRYSDDLRNTISKFTVLPMYYRIWRGNLLTKKSNNTYDIVIRARTDIIFDKDLILEKNNYINVPAGLVYSGAFECDKGIIDCFGYGNFKVMDYYSLMFLQLMQYVMEGHYLFPVEHLLLVHLSKINLNIKFIPNYMGIVRESVDDIEWFNNFVPKHHLVENVCNISDIDEIVLDVKSEFKISSIKNIFIV